ncbi:GFA family protein [Brucella sp. IR073]|uniref:GFA family protein n=1 Tax=unclassified Brucella TaxID=2632610 RepID=UPI003B9815D4
MSENERHAGSCLCGAVRFETNGPLRGILYCHCTQCRKQSGHYFAATNVADDDIRIDGAENISWYQSSEKARRGFCRICGSVLFWKRNGSGDLSVLAGAFDKPSGLHGEMHIFTADKGDYYGIDDGLPQRE